MTKKKENKTPKKNSENENPSEINDVNIRKTFEAASKSSPEVKDKFEELDLEDENEAIGEEEADEEDVDYSKADKKHYDDEETELEEEAKENLEDNDLTLKPAKKKSRKK